MHIEAVEFHWVRMPPVRPFRTSFGSQQDRQIVVLGLRSDGVTGWSECVALTDPVYSSEYQALLTDVWVSSGRGGLVGDRRG